MTTEAHRRLCELVRRAAKLALCPGEDRLENHDDLDEYSRVEGTMLASGMVFNFPECQLDARKKSVSLDGKLSFLNGLKLAQQMGIFLQTVT